MSMTPADPETPDSSIGRLKTLKSFQSPHFPPFAPIVETSRKPLYISARVVSSPMLKL
jgi:hypothetical protein